MCGIAGLIDLENGARREWLEAMAATLARRGPDDSGFLESGAAGLAHRRLSVIDLGTGRQPIFNEDRSLAIVCNGELYDFHGWRATLEGLGHRFATSSDSEVLLHLYEEMGPAFLPKVNGMFALAILHLRENRIFLARDRFGKKPLFYCAPDSRHFAFASGPAALAALPWMPRGLDLAAIHDFLEYECVPAPGSVYRAVRKLPPHHWALWENGALRMESWWEPRVEPAGDGMAYADAVAETRRLMTGAVRRRLVADVPLGVFLSGGMDSSITAALAQRLQPEGRRIKSFSIGFPEKAYDERAHAAAVAAHLGTDHRFLEVHPENFARLPDVVSAFEEPFADASMLPTSLLAEFTRREVTVALSGDGADELFGGYERYRVMHRLHRFDGLPRGLRAAAARPLLALLPPKLDERTASARLRRVAELLGTDGLERYRRLLSRAPESLRRRIYGPAMRGIAEQAGNLEVLARHFRPHAEIADALMETDLSVYLPDDIPVKVDRASMAFALEVRSPFLDRDVAEFALRLPYDWKQKGAVRKRILRDAFADLLPAEIFARPKMGFAVPLARWFRNEWRARAEELLPAGRAVELGIFDGPALRALLAEHCAPRADHSHLLFSILVLELWLRGRPAAG